MKKITIYIILCMLLSLNAYAVEYNQINASSIFIVGVDWQKLDTTNYIARINIDLNYNQYANPLDRGFQIVEPYNFYNWWRSDFELQNVGFVSSYLDENGVLQERTNIDFYYELLDPVKDGVEEVSRVGFYGLPFYIQKVEFYCDIDNKAKGSLFYDPSDEVGQSVAFTYPEYEGLSKPLLNVENDLTIPIGFITRTGEVATYTGIPVYCSGMDSTDNAKLSFTLVPNPLYRHVDPTIENSASWNFQDIISSLPSLSNNNELPYNLNIDFNFTGNYWDYNITNEQANEDINNLFGNPSGYDLDCFITSTFSTTKLKYSELTSQQKTIINTGQGITCSYPTSPGVTNLNQRLGNNIIEQISLQQQRENVLKLDELETKFYMKRFFLESVIPLLTFIVVIIFYLIEIVLLGIAFFGIIPMMFWQFIKGLKDAFSFEDIKVSKKRRNE